MKKVLIAKQNLEKTYSGATRTVLEQIQYFKALGFEVHIIGETSKNHDLVQAGAIYHKTWRWPWQKRFKRRLQFSNQVLKKNQKINANVLIGHGDLQQQDVFLLHNCVHLAQEKIKGEKLPSTHEMYQIHTPILEKRGFSTLIANSNLMKQDLIERFNIEKSQITVIYPSIDPNRFFPLPPEERSNIKRRLKIPTDEYLVGLVTSGNLKKRGVDRFFKAINRLPEEIALKTNFIFVGKDKLDNETQEILDSSPYKERVRLMPVVDNVQEYFNALDIFVLPARIEEFGRVVAEAMGCGTPVITTKWVGASELIEGEARKFIYDGEDNQELSNLIQTLLRDKNLRENIGELNFKASAKAQTTEMFNRFDEVFSKY